MYQMKWYKSRAAWAYFLIWRPSDQLTIMGLSWGLDSDDPYSSEADGDSSRIKEDNGPPHHSTSSNMEGEHEGPPGGL